MNRVAVFDVDGTIYKGTLTISVAEELVRRLNLGEEDKLLRSVEKVWKERGSTESYWTYNKTALQVFKDIIPRISAEQLDDAIKSLLEREGLFRYAYTTALVSTLKKEGYMLIAMSGSIRNIVEPFIRPLGFDAIIASELEVVDGKYTGNRVRDTRTGKEESLLGLVSQHGLTMSDSIGVGDTHRDISLLSVVENPIAFNPNAALYEEASKRGWKIVIERKNMVYELISKDGKYVVENAHPSHDDNNQEHLR